MLPAKTIGDCTIAIITTHPLGQSRYIINSHIRESGPLASVEVLQNIGGGMFRQESLSTTGCSGWPISEENKIQSEQQYKSTCVSSLTSQCHTNQATDVGSSMAQCHAF